MVLAMGLVFLFCVVLVAMPSGNQSPAQTVIVNPVPASKPSGNRAVLALMMVLLVLVVLVLGGRGETEVAPESIEQLPRYSQQAEEAPHADNGEWTLTFDNVI